MNLSPHRLFCSLLLFSVLVTNGQTTTPHTLLWRITGKGLQKPSYLYGTMHLNDKRLFRFDDSVYGAIGRSEGLAIEVNPDEMGAYFVNRLFDQMEKGKKLKDVVGQRYFDRNRKALSRKFHKPADDISASDVVKEKNKWMSDILEKGEMPTFMDAYLYNIARRQGKWVGGIEDIGDQAGLLNDLVDQSDVNYLLAADSGQQVSGGHSMTEKMIDLYAKQDLDGIEAITDEGSTPEQKDKLLIIRNIKMARRMDSLTSLRTMFLAVGAAHLPGDSGVISLLRGRGFTVEPVFSNKKIEASTYTFQEVHIPWVKVADQEGAYTAEMPGNPASVKLYGMIEMKFLMDLFNLSGFCTMALINPSRNPNKDSIFDAMAARMFKTLKTKAVGKSLEKNGVKGREYIQQVSGSNLRVQVFADDQMVYMAMLSSLKKETLSSADADKFFQSYTILPRKQEPAGAMTTFADPIMGVSFSTPVPLVYNQKLSSNTDDSWKVTCFAGADPSTGAYFMLFSKEVKPGYYIHNDSIIHEDFYQKLKGQYPDLHREDTVLGNSTLAQFSGRNLEQPNIKMQAMSVVRSGRHMVLMVFYDSLTRNSLGLDKIMHSLRLIPHPPVAWLTDAAPDSTFSSRGPSAIRPYITRSTGTLQWVSYDTTTATSYQIIPDTLGKYAWYASDSLFWDAMVRGHAGKETMLEEKDVTNGDVHGKEIMVKGEKGGPFYQRIRLLSSGDKIYKLMVSGEKELLLSSDVNGFFTSFRLKIPNSAYTATRSKAALLLHDLGSEDSAIRVTAYDALKEATFGKEDLSLLHAAVFLRYPPPNSYEDSTAVNDALAKKIGELGEGASVAFVKENYPRLVKDKKTLQNTALYVLAGQHTSGSYAALADLLKQGPSGERLSWQFRRALEDSLALTATLFPSLQVWAKDTLYTGIMADVTLMLLDSGLITREVFAGSGGVFIGGATALLPALRRSSDINNGYMADLIRLLGSLNTPAANELLQRYTAIKNKYQLQNVVDALLANGKPVNSKVFIRLAGDPASRSLLYGHLKKVKKTALFPRQYLTQRQFAEAAVYDAIDEEEIEEMTIKTVTFLSKKNATFQGKMYTWYLFKMVFDGNDGEETHLGIAGGYDLTGAGVLAKKDLSGICQKEQLTDKNSTVLFNAWLKDLTDIGQSDREEEKE